MGLGGFLSRVSFGVQPKSPESVASISTSLASNLAPVSKLPSPRGGPWKAPGQAIGCWPPVGVTPNLMSSQRPKQHALDQLRHRSPGRLDGLRPNVPGGCGAGCPMSKGVGDLFLCEPPVPHRPRRERRASEPGPAPGPRSGARRGSDQCRPDGRLGGRHQGPRGWE